MDMCCFCNDRAPPEIYTYCHTLSLHDALPIFNHAATAVEAAAAVAVAATATLPQLGFIHEDSAIAFTLDIADLFRDRITLPVAFQAVRAAERQPELSVDRHVRRLAGRTLREAKVIPSMIDRIKELFDADDRGRHP